MTRYLEDNRFYPRQNDIEAILRRVDHSGDQQLSFEEFSEVVEASPPANEAQAEAENNEEAQAEEGEAAQEEEQKNPEEDANASPSKSQPLKNQPDRRPHW